MNVSALLAKINLKELLSKRYTVIFVPDVTGQFLRYSVPKALAQGAIGLLAVFAVSLSFFVYVYQAQKSDLNELASLRRSKVALTQDLQKLSNQAKDIATQLARVEQFDKKLRVITAMEGAPGQDNKDKGGPNMDGYSPVSRDYTQSLMDNLNNELGMLKKSVDTQEVSLFELDEFFKDQSSLLAHTPSIWPAKGFVTSTFGYRRSPFTNLQEMHEGLDVATQVGSPVIAPANGVVTRTFFHSGYGNMVEIDHGYGVVTRYAHNSRNLVKPGQMVKRGTLIAEVGTTGHSTGPHMHYEVLLNGVPVNPERYILEE
jgi:murein DD-endopeptidase MepM/ murein hydrolase activator NlpD